MTRRGVAAWMLAFVLAVLVWWGSPPRDSLSDDRAVSAHIQAMRKFADGRRGYVVWESRRPIDSDACTYRIWKRNLDGSGLAMISGSADRKGYAHLGPRVSPDGRHVVFAGRHWNSQEDPQTPTLWEGQYAVGPFDAWIVSIDPTTLEAGEPRELVELRNRVGSGGEDCFFEWKDNHTLLVNLQSEGGIYEFDIRTGRLGVCRLRIEDGVPLMLTPDGRAAYSAQGSGAAVVTPRPGPDGLLHAGEPQRLPGCQMVPAHGRDYLVWMNAAGRGLARFDLRTRAMVTLPWFAEVLPASHRYFYFPRLSRDSTVLAIGGSWHSDHNLRHSHTFADYEIFLVNWHPTEGKPLGRAVRYSFNSHADHPGVAPTAGAAMDRWPDVWIEPPVPTATARHIESSRAVRTGTDSGKAEPISDFVAAAVDEQLDPPAALRAYELLAGSDSSLIARVASLRLAHLNRSPDFARQVRAWGDLEAMRKLEAAQRHRTLEQDEHAQLFTLAEKLVNRQRDTRAALEARSLLNRVGIDWRQFDPQPLGFDVVGRVRRMATVPDPSHIAPYNEALVAVEYRVERSDVPELADSSIVVYRWAVRGGKRLGDLGTLEPGTRQRLRLVPWEQQSHYHAHPVGDDLGLLDAPVFFMLDVDPVPVASR